MSSVLKVALVALASMLAGTASSSTLDFFLSGSGGAGSSYSYTSNGVGLTVTAGSFVGGANLSPLTIQDNNGDDVQGYSTSGNTYDSNALVGQFSNGLGVYNNTYGCNGGYTCTSDNSHTVDGSGWDDFLILSFTQAVQLTSVDFSYFGDRDSFRIFYDLNGNGILGDDDFLTHKYSDDPFFDFPAYSTDLIGFAATGDHDRWKLKSVHGHIIPTPLPAAGFFLLAGLATLGFFRRRNS